MVNLVLVKSEAGLVKGTKGAQGGYMLVSAPKEITVGMILRAIEGNLSVVPMEDETITNRIESYIRDNIWNIIDEKVEDPCQRICGC